jgi:hypothetical protein
MVLKKKADRRQEKKGEAQTGERVSMDGLLGYVALINRPGSF